MKTVKEWLESIQDEKVRGEALENMEDRYANEERSSLADALSGAFVWSATKQGVYYWNKQHFTFSKQTA